MSRYVSWNLNVQSCPATLEIIICNKVKVLKCTREEEHPMVGQHWYEDETAKVTWEVKGE